jgi:hypothetical protein
MTALFYVRCLDMMLTIYKTELADNVVGKVLSAGVDIWINAKSDFDIVSPVITLMFDGNEDYKSYNYAQISELNRFYFVTDVEMVHSRIVKLTLECDVLFTYREAIKASTARYYRNIKTGDYLDASVDMSVLKTASQHDSDTDAFVGKPTIILTTVGA